MKTLDINAMQWFDKVNGNSYFAGTVTLDFGTPEQQIFYMPFQYGYGSQYEQEGSKLAFPDVKDVWSLSKYCWENGIIYRHNLQIGCKKRDLMHIDDLIKIQNLPTVY